MSHLQYFLFSVIILVNIVHSARILCVYSIPSHSRQKVLRVLPEELVKRGHEVVIISPEPVKKNIKNLTVIDVSEVTYKLWKEAYAKKAKSKKKFAISASKLLEMASSVVHLITEAQIKHSEVQKLINDKMQNFDLLLVEDAYPTTVAIGARFRAPIISVTPYFARYDSFENLGSESNILLYPFFQKLPESFWDRIISFLEAMAVIHMIQPPEAYDNALISNHFGKDAPVLKELTKNIQMLFLSMNRMWDNNRAVGPSVTYMGTIHLKKPVSLPADLQNYLNSSKQGVIYMSLGSNTRSSDLPSHILRTILAVFASLPYEVIWKWDGEEIPLKPKNVRLEKWLPQPDLLRHPSMKLFITQGGLQSTDEAIAAQVPLLGLPVAADQFQNVQKYQEYGIGIGMDIDNLNAEDFKRTILEVAGNVKYRENIRRLSKLMSDQRTDGLERALNQIQKILEHGFYFLSPAAHISFFEYFMVDVFVPLVTGVVVIFVVLSMLVRKFLRSIRVICQVNKKRNMRQGK